MLQHLAYTVLGAGITAYTYYVTSTVQTKPAMYLFFLIGLGLVTYGVFGFVTSFITTGSRQEPVTEDVVACPNCGVKHYTTSNYCHKCGEKL